MAKNTPLFNYKDCSFHVEKTKNNTARVVIWKEFNVTNSFTLESSFYGYLRGDQVIPYTDNDYESIGICFLTSLLEYFRMLKQLEFELAITKGCLKPSQIVQLTGTPAADVIKKEIIDSKEEKMKKIRSEKVRQYIDAKRNVAKAHNQKHGKKQKYHLQTDNKALKPKLTKDSILKLYSSQPSKEQAFFPSIHQKPNKKNNADYTPKHTKKDKNYDEVSFVDTKIDDDDAQPNWKQYFSEEELNDAYNQISSGIDPNDLEKTISDDSISCSEDESVFIKEEAKCSPELAKTTISNEMEILNENAINEQNELELVVMEELQNSENKSVPCDEFVQEENDNESKSLPYTISEKSRSITNRKNTNILSKVVAALAKSHRIEYNNQINWIKSKPGESYTCPDLRVSKKVANIDIYNAERFALNKVNLMIEGSSKLPCNIKPRIQKRLNSNCQIPPDLGTHSMSPKNKKHANANPYELLIKSFNKHNMQHQSNNQINEGVIKLNPILPHATADFKLESIAPTIHKKQFNMKDFIYHTNKRERRINRLATNLTNKINNEVMNNSCFAKS